MENAISKPYFLVEGMKLSEIELR